MTDDIYFPKDFLNETTVRNEKSYYFKSHISNLRKELKEYGLKFNIKVIDTSFSLRSESSTLYDIEIKFKNKADAAFYKMIISKN